MREGGARPAGRFAAIAGLVFIVLLALSLASRRAWRVDVPSPQTNETVWLVESSLHANIATVVVCAALSLPLAWLVLRFVRPGAR